MKKIIISICILTMVSCNFFGTPRNIDSVAQDELNPISKDGNLKIGILQFAQHPSLDSAREGFISIVDQQFPGTEYTILNCNGDVSNTAQMAGKLIGDDVDLIYAIGTPAAQGVKNATKSVPIVFSAVTDPIKSGLVDSSQSNVTGCSDKVDCKLHLQLYKKIDPSIDNIGIVYSTSEINSQIQVKESKVVAQSLGLNIVDVGINNINDIPQAIDAMLSKSDAVYAITDNLVAKSIDLLAEKSLNENKPLIMGYIDKLEKNSSVFMSSGFSYYEHGKDSAIKAIDILKYNKKPSEIDIGYIKSTKNYISPYALKRLNININNPIIKEGLNNMTEVIGDE